MAWYVLWASTWGVYTCTMVGNATDLDTHRTAGVIMSSFDVDGQLEVDRRTEDICVAFVTV